MIGLRHRGDGARFREFGTARLVHLPGLDGLRGLAVAGVICFHGNWPWMQGGYLGVSLFFTLSGFLITSLLLVEQQGGPGGISLRRFWGRRFRRVLPAAWLTLLAVLIAGWFVLDANEVSSFRGDVRASLLQVANWRFLFEGQSYGDLFRSPSPVLHFWSLSIEEQLYLLYPLLLVGLLAVARGRRHLAALVLGIGALLSWGLPVLLGASLDRIYYGTDTRAGELLAGALLALVVANPRRRQVLTQGVWLRTGLVVGGIVALVATIAMWVTIPRTGAFLSSGGLAAVSVASVVLVLSAASGVGPVAAICGWGPLRWAGRVSYGAYLFHWPLLVFMTERRTGLSHLPRFLLVVVITFVLAELSLRFVEQPVRQRSGLFARRRIRPALVTPFVLVALFAGLLAISPEGRRQTFDFDRAQANLEELNQRTADEAREGDDLATRPVTRVEPAPARGAGHARHTPQRSLPSPPEPKVAVFGDSTMLSLALLLGSWQLEGAPLSTVEGEAQLGCGIARGGLRKTFMVEHTRPDCDSWATTWARQVRADNPDVAVVAPGEWELVDHTMQGSNTVWRRVGDPIWDAYLRDEIVAANDVLASNGALVVWLTVPDFGTVDADRLPEWQRSSHDTWRVQRLNEILREAVAERPDTARLVDLAAWMVPHTNDTEMRDDGTHYDWTDDNPVVSEFVGPQVLHVWKTWWTDLAERAAG